MSDHTTAMCAVSTGATNSRSPSPASRIVRVYAFNRTTNGSVRPYVIPWTTASDTWGIAFPAGLVGVVTSFNTVTGAGAYNDRMEANWGVSGGGAILVPGVLPAGYTARLVREWHSAAQSLARVRTADGYNTMTWMPSTSPFGESRNFSNFNYGGVTLMTISGLGTEYGTFASSHIGWRNLQWRLRYPTMDTSGLPNADLTLRISHNADGSNPGAALGDTTDWTDTINTSTIPHTGSAYESAWEDLAIDLHPTLGTVSTFRLDINYTWVFGLLSFIYEFRMSPRLDVPYPFTATGIGDLIAPGGLVT